MYGSTCVVQVAAEEDFERELREAEEAEDLARQMWKLSTEGEKV